MTSSSGIIFEVLTVRNVPNSPKSSKTSLMALDVTESLDFLQFKHALFRHIGQFGNFPIKYINEDSDQTLIETEEDFKKAMKVAQNRSLRGKLLLIVVDITSEHDVHTSSTHLHTEKPKKHYDIKRKIPSKKVSEAAGIRGHPLSSACEGHIRGLKATSVNIKAKPLLQQLANMSTIISDGSKSRQCACSDNPPPWFFVYMNKLKQEILQDVKEIIKTEKGKKEIKQEKKPRTRVIKRQEDELCDNSQSRIEQRNLKLLRKIEKLQSKEKKLENKLDQRIEKMETKKKRMLEKVSHSRNGKRKLSEESGSEGCGAAGVPNWLSGISVSKLLPIHVQPGQVFSRTWEVLNNGIVPWTEATELREIFWHPNGLLPEKTIVKCPPLKSGEKGSITVTFTAPDNPGIYESCWNFFHMGEIFGCGIACTIIVDAREENSVPQPTNAEVVEKKFEDVAGKIEKLKLENDEEYNSSSDSDSIVTDSDDSGSFVVVNMPARCVKRVQDEFKGLPDQETVSLKLKKSNLCDILKMSNTRNAIIEDKSEATNSNGKHDIQLNTCKMFQVANEKADNTSDSKTTQENNADVYVADRTGNITVITAVQQTDTASCYSITSSSTASSCVNIATSSASLYPKLELHSQRDTPTAPSCPDYHTQVEINEFLSCPNETGIQFLNTQEEHNGSEVSSVLSETTQFSNVEQKSPVARPVEQEQTENSEQTVPILPEALVNGAVNVAQSAYSVACNVLNTLRSKTESDTNGSDQQFKTNMALLSEMGFTNTICNAVLLKYYNNDIEKVVAAILSGGKVDQIPK